MAYPSKQPKKATADAFALIVRECREHGGPTEKCLRIYRRIYLHAPLRRSRYWEAVNEGTRQHKEQRKTA